MADAQVRSAARLAALIAIPVALVAGFVVFRVLNGRTTSSGVAAPSHSAGPQATSAVAMPAPSLADRPATVCRALLSQLPDAVRDRQRRPVTAGGEQNAAYGDPAITLACAAGPMPSYAMDADLYVVSGVCWYPAKGSSATTWTTVDREVPVTVVIPNSYDTQAQWVAPFSAPIVSSVPAIAKLPSGCTG